MASNQRYEPVATSEPPSPPVPVTLTIVPPPDDAVLYSPPPPYEPTDEHGGVPGNVTRLFSIFTCM